jgi:hypothetical protein
MRAIRDLRAVSRLALLLLFLIAMILGALISYMFVIVLYIWVPSKTSVNIVGATFSAQNATMFNVFLLNPSYSPSNATIKQIAVVTADSIFHAVTNVDPSLPYKIKPGGSENFTCLWDWSDYSGEGVSIVVFIDEKGGSGATFQAETPFVGLKIIEVRFNAIIDTLHFNVTVQNSEASATYVNIRNITIITETFQEEVIEGVTPKLPYVLNPSSSVTFACPWNWTDYRSKHVAILVYTTQGYKAYNTTVTPNRLILNITDVLFNPTDTAHFNITVKSDPRTSIPVTITEIKVTLGNGSVVEITQVTPALPCSLQPNASITFLCLWNWTYYQGKNVAITVYTQQGYVITRNQTISSLEEAAASSEIFSLGKQNPISSYISPTYISTTITTTIETTNQPTTTIIETNISTAITTP